MKPKRIKFTFPFLLFAFSMSVIQSCKEEKFAPSDLFKISMTDSISADGNSRIKIDIQTLIEIDDIAGTEVVCSASSGMWDTTVTGSLSNDKKTFRIKLNDLGRAEAFWQVNREPGTAYFNFYIGEEENAIATELVKTIQYPSSILMSSNRINYDSTNSTAMIDAHLFSSPNIEHSNYGILEFNAQQRINGQFQNVGNFTSANKVLVSDSFKYSINLSLVDSILLNYPDTIFISADIDKQVFSDSLYFFFSD